MQLALRLALEQFRFDRAICPRSGTSLLQDFPDTLKRNGERLEISRFANGAERQQALLRVHQIVRAGAKHSGDFVVSELLSLAKHKLRTVQDELKHLGLLRWSHPALRLVSQKRLSGGAYRCPQGKRELLLQDDFDNSERGAPQCKGIA